MIRVYRINQLPSPPDEIEWRGNRLAMFSPRAQSVATRGGHSPAPSAKPPVVNGVLSDCASAGVNSKA
jgi:hypothetical protein